MPYLTKTIKAGLSALATSAVIALPALSQELRPPDAVRMQEFDATLGRVLKSAFATGQPEDLAILRQALRGERVFPEPEGDWNCRTIKLGGLLDLVVYPNFRCRITVSEMGWTLEKLTGSQRTMGEIIFTRQKDFVYRGVGFVGEAPSVDYDGLPRDSQVPVEPGQTRASVGIFEQMDANRARLMLPRPILESEFDILYLTR